MRVQPDRIDMRADASDDADYIFERRSTYGDAVSETVASEAMTNAALPIEGFRVGTEENPLVHPVTGERLVFRKRAADTGGELLEFVLRMAPGGFIATPHVHPNAEERFEVGGAPVMIQVGRTKRLYQPGEVALVPAGVAHNWWNPSDAESATLIQLRPALDMETLFETMFGLAADGKVNKRGMPNPLQMLVLARSYRREATPPPPLSWIVGPLSAVLAPIGRRMGYLERYDQYSGPKPAVAAD